MHTLLLILAGVTGGIFLLFILFIFFKQFVIYLIPFVGLIYLLYVFIKPNKSEFDMITLFYRVPTVIIIQVIQIGLLLYFF